MAFFSLLIRPLHNDCLLVRPSVASYHIANQSRHLYSRVRLLRYTYIYIYIMINRHPAIDQPPAITVFSRVVRHLITTLRYYRSGRWHLGNDCNSIRFGRALGEITTRRRVHADDMRRSWWREKIN